MRPTERTFYLGVIAVLSLLLFLVRTCSTAPKCKLSHCDEQVKRSIVVVKRDTVFVNKTDSTSWHIPKQATRSLLAQGWLKPGLTDTIAVVAPEVSRSSNRDSLALADYYQVKDYVDTNYIEGGQVVVENRVYMNRLSFQRAVINIKEKIVAEEKVVTNTVRETPTGQLYAGILGQGQKGDPLTAFGGQFLWKTKKDKIWSVSVLYGKGGQVIYQAGALFKLSFR